jgi:hypothetical protein
MLFHLAKDAWTGKAIAARLGRTPQSIRVKCIELGVRLKPPRRQLDRLRLIIEPSVHAALDREAERRGMSVPHLVRLLLSLIVSAGLTTAVLDKPMPKQPIDVCPRRCSPQPCERDPTPARRGAG